MEMEDGMQERVSETEYKNSSIMVSICCITYNQASYIRDALEGFVNQKTDFAYEVLIHDDASNDGTADIIWEYADRYQCQRHLQFPAGQRKIYRHVRGR